ncbi:division/cell wall cluster transcriptional repressor MraZ [Jannaschia rubra]|uniref:Transcriptional regulator MraZ n=1 Tax=Jannaschia rubra TaxID=282197 RepID=A0A0M6XLF7_9RHOB|nr:division/cell wall cluster transcriptional repressor MraZ [Jannaschia rubra]CTQ32020.1 cell division protein MraZ [Jannaschia rubra]SFG39678.1 MraZ protein [Jannaschia rubra]
MEQRFRGTSTHKVDAKGRVSIPADFRRVLDACDPAREAGTNPRMVLCFGDDRVPYYTIYTMQGAIEMGEMIDDMDEGDPAREALEDYFYLNADTVTIDDSGRLILNAALRDRIGITDAAVFGGKGKTFRIHSPDAPTSATSRLGQVLSELPEGMPITSLLPKKRRAPE